MDATKPYEFIRFGAMDPKNPIKTIFKPYQKVYKPIKTVLNPRNLGIRGPALAKKGLTVGLTVGWHSSPGACFPIRSSTRQNTPTTGRSTHVSPPAFLESFGLRNDPDPGNLRAPAGLKGVSNKRIRKIASPSTLGCVQLKRFRCKVLDCCCGPQRHD